MPYDPLKHNRHSIRLPGFDYSQPATYFLTICTHNKQQLFSKIENQTVALTPVGTMIEHELQKLRNKYIPFHLDTCVIMPDHIHVIASLAMEYSFPHNDPYHPASSPSTGVTLSTIIQYFKSDTVKIYSRGVSQGVFPPYDKKLWQRSFHDRIIRNEEEHDFYREYIKANPTRWQKS